MSDEDIYTLVPYPEIANIAEKANEYIMQADESNNEEEKVAQSPHIQMI
jgi:hypothetical protein